MYIVFIVLRMHVHHFVYYKRCIIQATVYNSRCIQFVFVAKFSLVEFPAMVKTAMKAMKAAKGTAKVQPK